MNKKQKQKIAVIQQEMVEATNMRNIPGTPKSMFEDPPIGKAKAIDLIVQQRDFVDREILVQGLLELYAFNHSMFTLLLGDDLLKKVKFEDKYVDECVSEIAELVQNDKVWSVGNGIFSSWHLKKGKTNGKILTMEEATDTAFTYKSSDP